MFRRLLPLSAFGLFALLASCSTVKPGNVIQPAVIAKAKNVYVIRENPKNEIGSYLEAAIASKGYHVTSGGVAATRKDADLSVDYVDSWRWDLAMYLWSLDVTVRDNHSGEIVATGNFHQGFPHSFPDAQEKSRLVIESIFPGKAAPSAAR